MAIGTSKVAKSMRTRRKIKYKVKKLEIHSDKRGWLVEMLERNEIRQDIRQVYVATIKPGCIRGNHYHLKKTEWFFIAKGKANIYLEDIKTQNKICLKLSSKRPKVITIPPKIAHAVKNTGKETIYLVSAQNTIHNPKNLDSYPHLCSKYEFR